MGNVLQEICTAKREFIAAQRRQINEQALLKEAKEAGAPRGFASRLKRKAASDQFGLIAEIKKASPSKGVIRPDFDPASLAESYAGGGAACLSVLTDIPYFQGSVVYLNAAREAVSLPVLRKDFMIDPYQILESRAIGADAVLLIMAALSDTQARELEDAATALGMDTLIEVHDERELERALTHLKSPLIGVNSRNLKTLKVDIQTALTLGPKIPKHRLAVAESGIRDHTDLLALQEAGYSCFLVGESLMREADVAAATARLLGTA